MPTDFSVALSITVNGHHEPASRRSRRSEISCDTRSGAGTVVYHNSCNEPAAAHPGAQPDPRHYRHQVAQRADGPDYNRPVVAVGNVREVQVKVAPARRRRALGHILGEDGARADALNNH